MSNDPLAQSFDDKDAVVLDAGLGKPSTECAVKVLCAEVKDPYTSKKGNLRVWTTWVVQDVLGAVDDSRALKGMTIDVNLPVLSPESPSRDRGAYVSIFRSQDGQRKRGKVEVSTARLQAKPAYMSFLPPASEKGFPETRWLTKSECADFAAQLAARAGSEGIETELSEEDAEDPFAE